MYHRMWPTEINAGGNFTELEKRYILHSVTMEWMPGFW